MAIYKRDIASINLETGTIHRTFLNHSIGLKDQKADHFGIRVFRDGEPVDLTGVSVQGVFMPPQGDPIAITSGNIVSGNVAEVVLPQACYNYDGQFCLAIKLVDSNNSVTGTMRIVDGMVDNTHASGTVAPTSAVPTYQEILSTYDAMVAATAAANGAIAATYSSSSTYKVGDYCIHDGGLYRCTTAITTAEAWTSGHWTAAKIGPDVSDLKSAFEHHVDQMNTGIGETFYLWEQGSLNYSTGAEENSTAVCRTKGYFVPDKDTDVYISNPNTQTFALRKYNTDGTYAGQKNISSYTVYTFTTGYKYRLICTSTGSPGSVTGKFTFDSDYSFPEFSQDEYSTNLLSSSNYEDGKYLYSNGGLADATGWITFYMIPVHGCTKIKVFGSFGLLTVQNTGNIWAYNKYKQAISVAFNAETATKVYNQEVSLPANTEYISVCISKARYNVGHSGVYLNLKDIVTGIDGEVLDLYSGDTAIVTSVSNNGLLTLGYSSGTYTVTWAGESDDYFFVRYKNTQYKIALSSAQFIFPSGGLSLEVSGTPALVLDQKTSEVALKAAGSLGYGDIKLAWLTQNSNYGLLGNDILFDSSYAVSEWNTLLNQKNDGLFSRVAYLYGGTVEVDTTNKTATLTGVSVLGAKDRITILSNYTHTFDYSLLQNPTYAWAIFVNTQGAYIDNISKIANIQKNHTEYDYLLFVFYNNSFVGSTLKSNSWFINGIDVTVNKDIPYLYDKTARIFKKVVCCGDSYTSGHIVDGGGTAHGTNGEYAWPHYMALITGNTYVNCGSSGANVLTWQSNARGLPKAQTTGTAQAYIIGLGINDASDSVANHVDVGTTDDIGTDNQTYYGGLSKIVRELHTISPDSKIFIQTLPRMQSRYTPYNEAIRYIVEYYHDDYDTHLLDLYDYYNLYNVPSINGDSRGGHYTAIGYEQFAEILNHILSQYINSNISEFQDVFEVPYTDMYADNIPSAPRTNGTYVLQATVSGDDHSVSYRWVQA